MYDFTLSVPIDDTPTKRPWELNFPNCSRRKGFACSTHIMISHFHVQKSDDCKQVLVGSWLLLQSHLIRFAMADDQQFCLRWNDFQTNMVASFKHLRDEKSFCDVTIATEVNKPL